MCCSIEPYERKIPRVSIDAVNDLDDKALGEKIPGARPALQRSRNQRKIDRQ